MLRGVDNWNLRRAGRPTRFPVYFDTGSSRDPAIYRVRLGDHKLERVASLKDLRRVVTPFISWSGLTPDGFSLLMRDVGTQEVYALDFEAP
jgi:hypothetical protein